jgi:flagellar biosynthesis/type III secretory pathway M-ring protein FliF/YscJ
MDRRNRVRLAVLGLLLFAVGLAGLLVGADVFDAPAADSAILPEDLVDRWDRYDRNYPWNLVVVGVVALLLAWYGWRIVRAQFRRGGGRAPMGDLEYRATEPGRQDAGRGRTTVRAAAISRGTEAALEHVRGVERAIVGLFGSPYEPELRARLDVDANADLTQVRHNVSAALERLATTTGMPPRSADITLRLVERQQARVS